MNDIINLSQSHRNRIFVSRQKAVNLSPIPVAVTSTGNNRLTAFCYEVEMKTCRTCGEEKTEEEFKKDNRVKSGRDTQCKSCASKSSVISRNKNPFYKSIKTSYDKLYHQSNKSKRQYQRREYYQENKEAINCRHRENYAKNLERERKRSKEKYQTNPEKYKYYWRERRARQLNVEGGHYTEKEFRELCNYYGNKCLCCGISGIPLQADHVIPLGPPHSDEIENIQPLCEVCNKKKARKYIDYRS